LIRISNLQTSVGQQSRRGTAEFRVLTKGSFHFGSVTHDGPALTVWSLGFQESQPGVWKVNRITPVSIPRGALAMPVGFPTDDSRLGSNDGISILRPPVVASSRGPGRPSSRMRRRGHPVR
jgi:hypothetical protein